MPCVHRCRPGKNCIKNMETDHMAIFFLTSEDESMIKTTMKIDGMMCGMCEAHVCDAIRRAVPSAKKVSASRSKKEASFLTEAAVDADNLKAAIDATGYTCLGIESSPYEKKGLFGWK